MSFQLNRHPDPAYHLRTNKGIDRLILIDVVRVVDRLLPFHNSFYIGFGGPYLEDFKLFHSYFPELQLISIESDPNKYKRQQFHQFCKNIQLINKDFSEYLDSDFPSGERMIVWLDALDMNRGIIEAFTAVCRNVGEDSVVRLTVRAVPPFWAKGFKVNSSGTLVGHAVKNFEKYSPDFLNGFTDFIDNSVQVKAQDFIEPNYYSFLLGIVRKAVESCFPPSIGREFMPIHSSIYSDGTAMLSVTGVVAKSQSIEKYKKYFMEHFSFGCYDWQHYDIIDVPRLSSKERFFIEKHLPDETASAKTIDRVLGYQIGHNESDHRYKCAQYEKYFQFYPYFGRIVP